MHNAYNIVREYMVGFGLGTLVSNEEASLCSIINDQNPIPETFKSLELNLSK